MFSTALPLVVKVLWCKCSAVLQVLCSGLLVQLVLVVFVVLVVLVVLMVLIVLVVLVLVALML